MQGRTIINLSLQTVSVILSSCLTSSNTPWRKILLTLKKSTNVHLPLFEVIQIILIHWHMSSNRCFPLDSHYMHRHNCLTPIKHILHCILLFFLSELTDPLPQVLATGVFQVSATGVFQVSATSVFQVSATGVFQVSATGVFQVSATGVFQVPATGVFCLCKLRSKPFLEPAWGIGSLVKVRTGEGWLGSNSRLTD